VPIRTIDDENAQEWFEWLLADGIGTYMSHDKFKDYAYKIVTNHFSWYRIFIPEIFEFAQKLRNSMDKKKYFYLKAPEELPIP